MMNNTNKNYLVSILIPSYNAEKTIKDALQSALNQTYKNIEIIVVDDCSKDNTLEVVKSFDDSRLVLVQNKTNLGMVNNWNKCIELAKGDYIHYLHGDDILNADCIEKKVNALKDDTCLVISDTDIINGKGDLVFTRTIYNSSRSIDGVKFAKKSFRLRNYYGEPSCVLIKKDLVEKVGYFNNEQKYSVDFGFFMKASKFGNIEYIHESLQKYRISNENVTYKTKFSDYIEDDKILVEDTSKFINFSKLDILMHKIVFFFRNIARKVYMTFFG